MYKITGICDRCKKEETRKGSYFETNNSGRAESDGWQEVEIKINQYTTRKYLFCIECRKSLELYSEQIKSFVYTPTVADRLFEVISEIVQEAKEGQP